MVERAVEALLVWDIAGEVDEAVEMVDGFVETESVRGR